MTTVTNSTTNDPSGEVASAGGGQVAQVLGEQRSPSDEQVTDEPTTPAGEQVMDLLEGHVPLSLIMDLTAPAGPDSQDILSTEGKPDASWWLAH